jgi:hypothetical protein
MEYICEVCNKKYSSYQSLWIHNKKFHNKNTQNAPKVVQNTPKIEQNNYKCINCSKQFTRKYSLDRHNFRCKIKHIKEYTLLKEQNQMLLKGQEELKELKKQMSEIMKKINIKNSKLVNNFNCNNTTNNNIINIIELGKENLSEIFSKQEKLNILRKGKGCFTHLIEYTHLNEKYPQFHSILITNMQNNIAYLYNTETNKFEATTKDELLHNIFVEQTIHIYDFNNECGKYLSEIEKKRIQEVIDKLDNNCEIFEKNQKNKLKLIIYNNRHKITKELSREIEIII